MQTLWNIYRLGVKELWSLWRDPIMLVLIVFSFTFSVYSSSKAVSETLTRAPIAIVDEDQSQLSNKIAAAFYPPHFTEAAMVSFQDIDRGMDEGLYTFALIIPHGLQADVVAGKAASVQLNVDATRMSQAFSGSGAIQQIVNAEVAEFSQRYRAELARPEAQPALQALRDLHQQHGSLILLTAAKDVAHSHLPVLQAVLEQKAT